MATQAEQQTLEAVAQAQHDAHLLAAQAPPPPEPDKDALAAEHDERIRAQREERQLIGFLKSRRETPVAPVAKCLDHMDLSGVAEKLEKEAEEKRLRDEQFAIKAFSDSGSFRPYEFL